MISLRLGPAGPRATKIPSQRAAVEDHPVEPGVATKRIRSLLAVLPPAEVSDCDVLLDIGSDARQLIVEAALRYPFRRIVGVAPVCVGHETPPGARERDHTRMREASITHVRSAAADLDLPDDVTVMCLSDTLSGADIKDVVQRLTDSVRKAPRWVRLICSGTGAGAVESALWAADSARHVRTSTLDETRIYLIAPSD